MNLAKLGYIVGAILFVMLLMAGRFKFALLILAIGMVWGILRIRQFLLEAKEREARMWQADETILLPKRKQ